MTKACLVLSDGTVYRGQSFGFEGETAGEVVFNTSMTGYQEILTDPSYCRQIVILTYPMIGNTGVNPEDVESKRPQVAGLIVKEYCKTPSNWRSSQTLAEYLQKNKIVAVEGLPTREIVRHIRERGAQPGILTAQATDLEKLKKRAAGLEKMEGRNLVGEVTCDKPYLVKAASIKKFRVAAYDFGIKQNIVRELTQRGCEVLVVPALTPPKDILSEKPDGILLSNGPGDPAACLEIIENFKPLIGQIPILGICLGHQLLALALGAKTFKLKFGHRGANQPVKDLESGKVLITSQNHGFAVDPKTLTSDMEMTQVNLNDQTVEAFRHKRRPILSIQYHPEASPGPHDAKNFFNEFTRSLVHGPRSTVRSYAQTHRHP
ncbi:MAG: glutamine-hydrolyzing carbamoyl-phosphate synthase small subunit [Deltaproteobacteria bacterium]|nr:glutamine-hydrolyzing carbamoyl-phosphate synthase small subunit [Deltaproteobacteria bacterium]MBI4224413.1 glutamine-hydrolyzing carbamoyl-phosphate synthase small subunit [Deltaproteobacteria bacterium]